MVACLERRRYCSLALWPDNYWSWTFTSQFNPQVDIATILVQKALDNLFGISVEIVFAPAKKEQKTP